MVLLQLEARLRDALVENIGLQQQHVSDSYELGDCLTREIHVEIDAGNRVEEMARQLFDTQQELMRVQAENQELRQKLQRE